MCKKILLLAVALTLLLSRPVSAQTSGPVYIVQSGDTLWDIAIRFNVAMTDLMTANGLSDANLHVGQELVIPGLEGLTGVLDTEVVGFGDSLRGLARRNQTPVELLRRLNHITSPSELYVGVSLVVPKQDEGQTLTASASPAAGETLLEVAVRENSDPWTLSSLNSLNGTWDALPGDVLYSKSGTGRQTASGLPAAFVSTEVKRLPFKQGGTAEIIVQPAAGATLGGMLVDHPLRFVDTGDGKQVALQGIHVELEPGAYPLRLDATLPDGSVQSFEQMVLVKFGVHNPNVQPVPPMDPKLTEEETQLIASIASAVTPVKYWQAAFTRPVGSPYCVTEWFGTPRTYTFNGDEFGYFHSGVDYGVCSETNPLDIFAAAPGKVVFTGLLNIRGNATIIDNGWGVYTVYGHQSEIRVVVGQDVQAGDIIGQIGSTGHVTGPHLHWEMWVNGVQVDPLDWLDAAIP
ncbi:MAG: hypothetical protein B6D40_00815 [Anaerolineae bacterium UTCFX3]|jgi:murein DD-endopeptidase MepM/ murein hydrolase activator NlpD|nr:MAG: hypothetical protein B6D40_00815 [Anaerolineae bacterium UTCFX3]